MVPVCSHPQENHSLLDIQYTFLCLAVVNTKIHGEALRQNISGFLASFKGPSFLETITKDKCTCRLSRLELLSCVEKKECFFVLGMLISMVMSI